MSRILLQLKRPLNPIPVETLPTDRRMDADQESLDLGASVCTCLVSVKRLLSGAGAGVCGQSVYLRGGTTPSWSTAFSGLTLLFPPHPSAYSCVWRTSRAKGSVWLPPTLAAIISKRKKVAGAAATTRHATNSSN